MRDKTGVLVISHGSRDHKWVKDVEDAVDGLRQVSGLPVACAYLELVSGRLIQDGIDQLEADGVEDIIVIPLFISSGSTHIDEIRYALGLQLKSRIPTSLQPFRHSARMHWRSPLDDSPEVAEMVLASLGPLVEHAERKLLLVVGHGSKVAGFHQAWLDSLRGVTRRAKLLGGFAAADTAMLSPDQVACKLRSWRRRRPDLMPVVAPLFLSEGYFTKQVIPRRIEGLDCEYGGKALLPSPQLQRWLLRQVSMDDNG